MKARNWVRYRMQGILWMLVMVALTAQAQVGVLQGIVNGVPPGTLLGVFRGEEKVADIKIEAGQKYTITLKPGAYVVRCPSGTSQALVVLNGSAAQNISC